MGKSHLAGAPFVLLGVSRTAKHEILGEEYTGSLRTVYKLLLSSEDGSSYNTCALELNT
jgi:hypothetical protein